MKNMKNVDDQSVKINDLGSNAAFGFHFGGHNCFYNPA